MYYSSCGPFVSFGGNCGMEVCKEYMRALGCQWGYESGHWEGAIEGLTGGLHFRVVGRAWWEWGVVLGGGSIKVNEVDIVVHVERGKWAREVKGIKPMGIG